MKNPYKSTTVALIGIPALLAGYVAFNWARDRPVSALRERWAPPPSIFVDIAGMRIHLRDEGPRNDRTPIVLLHGAASSLHTWDGWVKELSKTRRVVRFDLPGFGLTGPTPDGIYSFDRYARFVISVVEKLEIGRFHLAGNSLGGNVAWYTALTHSERVEKLILVDATGYRYQSDSVPLALRLAKLSILKNITAHFLPRGLVVHSIKNIYGDPTKVTDEQVDRYYELALRDGNRTNLAERFEQLPIGRWESLIRQLHVATLIIWGAKDRLVPVKYARRFHQDIEGSQLRIFDQLGHVPQEEDPVSTVAAVEAFIL